MATLPLGSKAEARFISMFYATKGQPEAWPYTYPVFPTSCPKGQGSAPLCPVGSHILLG